MYQHTQRRTAAHAHSMCRGNWMRWLRERDSNPLRTAYETALLPKLPAMYSTRASWNGGLGAGRYCRVVRSVPGVNLDLQGIYTKTPQLCN